MSEWKEIIIVDLCERIVDCVNRTAPVVEYVTPYKMIRTTNVRFGKIDTENVRYATEATYKKWIRRCKPEVDDIILTREAPVGEVGRITVNDNLFLGQRTMMYRANPRVIDPHFLFYSFFTKFIRDQILSTGMGSVVEHIRVPDAKEFIVKYPTSISEQKAIASVLSSLDDKIDLLHRQNATLEAMAETLFRQWFVEEAKEDWGTKQLVEVTDIGIGRTPPRKEFHWFSSDSNDVKWISIKDMGDDGVFIYNTSEYLTRQAIKTFNIPVIPKHTVVLSFKMTVGRVAITTDEMLSNEAIAHFKFNKNTPFTKEYLFLFLKSFKYDLLGSTSSIVTSINSAMIKEMEIPIPDSQTMNEFKESTEPLFNKINQNQAKIRTLTALRDTLLPKLMSGEVRVEI